MCCLKKPSCLLLPSKYSHPIKSPLSWAFLCACLCEEPSLRGAVIARSALCDVAIMRRGNPGVSFGLVRSKNKTWIATAKHFVTSRRRSACLCEERSSRRGNPGVRLGLPRTLRVLAMTARRALMRLSWYIGLQMHRESTQRLNTCGLRLLTPFLHCFQQFLRTCRTTAPNFL